MVQKFVIVSFKSKKPCHRCLIVDTLNIGYDNPEKYYNDLASEYEAVVRGWGYNMPGELGG